MKIALDVSDKTNGIYDITVGSLVNNLGFGPSLFLDNQYVFESYSLKFLIDDKNKSISKYKDVVFDLSSVAKGYAVDEISNYLLANNFNNYLIDIGGEIAANGSSKNGIWTIGIQDPQSLQQNVSFTVPNSDKFIGVATSGDYLNFKYLDGELVTHSIDSSSDIILNAVANASALLTEDSSKTVTERILLSLDLIILGSIEWETSSPSRYLKFK